MIRFETGSGEAGSRLHILDGNGFTDFDLKYKQDSRSSACDLKQIKELKLSGCRIDDFSFLQTMPALEKLYILDCESQDWHSLRGTPGVISLGLHNLKCGKKYLDSTSFLTGFPNLEYLLVIMLGIGSIPEAAGLQKLHTVFGEFRNENDKKLVPDFSPLGDMKNLKVFDGWMAVDRHRIPAEAFIPVIENPSLESFTYTQMYATEEKRITGLIGEKHPSLLETSLSFEQLMKIRSRKFAD